MGQEGFTGPVNLGNPVEFTMLDLARTVLRLTGSAAPIAHRPAPPDDPRQRRPDVSLAETALGWTCRTPLEEGLTRTIPWFRRRLSEAESLPG
jgi:UDP-glucuronate decarboxylase